MSRRRGTKQGTGEVETAAAPGHAAQRPGRASAGEEVAQRPERGVRPGPAFFRAVLEGSPDTLVVIGADRRLKYLSAAARSLVGRSEGDTAPLDEVLDLVHPDDRDAVAEAFGRVAGAPGSVEGTRCRIRKAGRYQLVEAVGRNLLDDPDVAGVVVTARNITQQHALEEQLRQAQKLESVGRLAGGVAHDFNNVLTVILATAELLRDDAEAGRPSEPGTVQEIAAAAGRARELTRHLLAFARKQVVSPQVLDLNERVRGAERMVARLLGDDVALELRLDAGLWPVRLDPAQVDEILLNLVANARDALPGGGRVEIGTRNVRLGGEADAWAAAGDWVALTVADDGLGMTPEVKARLFEPFFTTKKVGQGTGLGLATLHGIVSQAGGCVRVESEPGQGSRFEVYFPRTDHEATACGSAPGVPSRIEGSERVLLVEDDLAVRQLAVRALTGAGYSVLAAADGLEALEVARAAGRCPELLVTDIVMPRLDGRRLADILRERCPRMRVLLTSGYAGGRPRGEDGDVPAHELVQKPFTGSELLRRVRSVLDEPAPGEP